MSETGKRLSDLSAAGDIRHSDLFLVSQENTGGELDAYESHKLTYAELSSAIMDSFTAADEFVPLTAVTQELGSNVQKVTSQKLVTDKVNQINTQIGQLSTILVGQLNYLNRVV